MALDQILLQQPTRPFVSVRPKETPKGTVRTGETISISRGEVDPPSSKFTERQRRVCGVDYKLRRVCGVDYKLIKVCGVDYKLGV